MNQNDELSKNIPKLRFSEFDGEWTKKSIGTILERVSVPVDVEKLSSYRQIGIRSHGKGIFYKEAVLGSALGNKNVYWVQPDAFIVNIVFAWEQAVAKTTKNEIGMIASHRFPMYVPLQQKLLLDFILQFFLTKKGKYLLELASPGGAGRNKTLGQKNFEGLIIDIPDIAEQEKIVVFVNTITDKILALQSKVDLLQKYKKGMMQKIFTQKIRFKDENGNAYPDWKNKILGDISNITMGQSPESSAYNNDCNGLYLIQGNADIKNRRTSPRFWTSQITKTCKVDDVILTVRAPSGYVAISDHNACIGRGVCSIESKNDSYNGFIYQFLLWFEPKWISIEQGSTFTAISRDDIRSVKLNVPSLNEQKKLSNFLATIDDKINIIQKELQQTKKYKKGLLQQMFI